jgi:hypothetical protein
MPGLRQAIQQKNKIELYFTGEIWWGFVQVDAVKGVFFLDKYRIKKSR